MAKSEMKITDLKLKSLLGKPQEKTESFRYKQGLFVRISKVGGISWYYRSRFKGKIIKVGLGKYPAIKITGVVDLADEYSKLISEGKNPRKKDDGSDIITFNDLFEYKISTSKKQNADTKDAQQKAYAKHFKHIIGHLNIHSI
ncbi:Arm DNA-binding domain-containing protein [Vibrio sp. SS-MA-C1-2]|uniref:Arm DNA-binding domain-containing protein n=1 Tax=Vibrio sp. SS-MA-C1-2 TaxID=2908646 RepID=UPI001F367A23|nr:Arm DNA-binding domain-containing protein [Vibrio sp. SS-MA-C1-2]UJF17627.1 Arm DNA-binding domain-containing protein [Vibrio sp. SS-MA-C1-2]